MPEKLPSGRWRTDFYVTRNGRRKRIREWMPDARTKAQAELLENRIRDQMFEGIWQNQKAAQTIFVTWAKKHWLDPTDNPNTHRSKQSSLNEFKRVFGNRTFAEMCNDVLIQGYLRNLIKSGRAPATRNRKLAALSGIFSQATRLKIIKAEDDPTKRIKPLPENNERARVMTAEEMERLMLALRERPTLHTAVMIYINTGLRVGELLKLKKTDVNWAEGLIAIRNTKTKRDRTIPMNDLVRDELESLRFNGSEFFFPGNGKTGHQTTFKKSWSATIQEANIENLQLRDLRINAASFMLAAGVSEFVIMEILGHTTTQMTKRYAKAMDYKKREAVSKLQNFSPRPAHEGLQIVSKTALTG